MDIYIVTLPIEVHILLNKVPKVTVKGLHLHPLRIRSYWQLLHQHITLVPTVLPLHLMTTNITFNHLRFDCIG